MKIMYITFDDMHSNFAWAIHTKAVVKRLSNRGHSVLLVAPNVEKNALDIPNKSFQISKNKLIRLIQYFITSGLHFLYFAGSFKPDVIYCRGAHFTLTPLLPAIVFRKPFVLEINGLLEDALQNSFTKFIFKIAQQIYLTVSICVVTVSELLKKGLCDRYRIRTSKVYVIANGADCEKFSPMDKETARHQLKLSDSKTILFVGSFYKHHGLDLLVSAAKVVKGRVPNVQFILVGDGPTRKEIESMVADNGLNESFIFTGERPHSEMPLWIAAADICVCILINYYSKYYGFSILKLYEYMASARPVIAASNMEDIVKFIEARDIGLVALLIENKEENTEDFADKLIKLLQDGELRKRLGQNGRRLALEQFNWDRTAAEVEQTLLNISK